jgi:predicted dehydrogenase
VTPAPVRLGLVGAGRWGRNIIRTIGESRAAVLSRVASANPETRRLVPADCVVDTDWRRVVGDRSLDGVVLAVPPRLQPVIAMAALDAGRAVMAEKPLALSVAEAEAIERRAEEVRRPVLVDHVYLFHPAWVELIRRSKASGSLRHVRSAGGNDGPLREDLPVLWDWAPHDIAMCLDLIGAAPDRVAARRVRRTWSTHGVGEVYALDLEFGGVRAEIEVGNAMPSRVRRFEAAFEAATLVFDDAAPDRLTENGAPVRLDPRPPLTCAVEAFADCVRSGAAAHPSLALGVEVVRTIARCEAALPPAAAT